MKRLSQPWSHPVVLNTRHLDWQSITLTSRPLPHKQRYFEIQIHFCLPHLNLMRKKPLSVTPCSCARNICYTSSILVKIIDLIQLFFHMLTLKALVYLNITNHFSSELNFSMNQMFCYCMRIIHYS